MRVAELLTENKTDKQVVGLKEVDQVIRMGQPEDYIIEEDNHDTTVIGSTQKKQKIIPRYRKND
jgi:hypothetical protein